MIEIQKQVPWENDLTWEKWLKNADQYLAAATPKGEKSKFGPDLLYNLLSMSLEGYVMAIMDFHDALPENHTFTDLIMAIETVIPLEQDLKNRILGHESIQSICSIDKYQRRSPAQAELADLKDAVQTIGKMAHKVCRA